ncbi:MAG: hypothetical protein V7641_1789 [Blastocatellia bacterium]
MDALLKYLQPDNPIAKTIVAALIIIFLFWLVALAYSGIRLMWQQRQMQHCADVKILKRMLLHTPGKEKAADETLSAIPADREANREFQKFCDAKSIKEGSLVARHLRTIFDAGLTGGHLEVGELIKHTTNELFRRNGSLRSVLATFIVLGLLGTLFGLADSLSQLSPIAPAGSAQSNTELSLGLSHLLSQLKSAFAPSICGIAFTILGLILFTAYLQFACAPIRNTLESLTLSVWVPQLFPTTTKRLQETLQISQQQLTENMVAAQEVAVFAKSIQSEVGDLNQSFQAANKSLRLLAKSSDRINTFADKFGTGVDSLISSLSPFQKQLTALYDKMLLESRAFHDNVKTNIEAGAVFQENAQAILKNQNQQLQEVLKTLQAYEDAYISTRKGIDARLAEVLHSLKQVGDDLGARNRTLVEAIGDPLRTDLNNHLVDIRNTLGAELRAIQNKFNEFDVPIKAAAKTMDETLETVVKQTKQIVQQLRGEIRGQNEKNHEQLQHLGAVNKHIEQLLQELPLTRQFQGEQAKALSDNVAGLSQNFALFGSSIAEFGRSLNLTGEHFQQLHQIEEQNKQIVAALNQLSSNSQPQNGQFRTLIEKVTGIEREVNLLNSRVGKLSQEARDAGSRSYQADRFVERNKPTPMSNNALPNNRQIQSAPVRPETEKPIVLPKENKVPTPEPELPHPPEPASEKAANQTTKLREYTTVRLKPEAEGPLTSPQQEKSWFRRLTGKLPFMGDK